MAILKRRVLPGCSCCDEAEWFVLLFPDGDFARVCPTICGLSAANRIAFTEADVILTWQAIAYLERSGRIGVDITDEHGNDLAEDIRNFTKLSVPRQAKALASIGNLLIDAQHNAVKEMAKQFCETGTSDHRLHSFLHGPRTRSETVLTR